MHQYIYKPAEAGLDRWPPGELRLDGIPVTEDPNVADVFVCPGSLSGFLENGVLRKERLSHLPHWAGNEARHAFLDVSDNFTRAIGLPCLFIRCDLRTWMWDDDPHSINVAWPVEDFAECVDLPEAGFTYDVSFHAWLSTDTRRISSQSCLDHLGLRCDMARYEDFTGYIYHEPEGVRRRAEFRRSMRESRVCLCPESIPGVFPYRFFEAMSAGRVPILIASDVVFPFDEEIPYDAFMLHIERQQAGSAGEIIAEFLRNTSDVELITMGLEARASWLRWLNAADWPKTMAYAVEKQLQTMGLVSCA